MAANIERGEVEVLRNGTAYTLKLSMNAAVIVQSRHSKKIGVLLREAEELDFAAIRAIVWLLLQKHHASEFKTEEQAGNFIDDAGGVHVFFDTLRRLGEANAPEGGVDPNPEAQGMNGTGMDSMSVPVALA